MVLRRFLFVLGAAVVLLPATAPGEVIRLRDQSTLNGRLLKVTGDTLTVQLSAGPVVRLHRAHILSIVFDEVGGVPALPPGAARDTKPVPDPVGGVGSVAIVFEDREVSSKIEIEKKRDWEGHERANHLVLEFSVDGRVAHSVVDTTTDKRIYKGHVTQLKNDVELEDFELALPAGVYRCNLTLRNRGSDQYRDDFEPDALVMSLDLDNIEVRANQTTRVTVGIARGKLRLGRPRFYAVE